MKTKTVSVYQFDELLEDAKTIGLEIKSLDGHRENKGSFKENAPCCADLIISNHGEVCDSYKLAKDFLDARDKIVNETEKDENGELSNEYQLDKELDALEETFLHDLLESYRIMLNKDFEFHQSNECVDESIRCNEYEFTEDGKRFDY